MPSRGIPISVVRDMESFALLATDVPGVTDSSDDDLDIDKIEEGASARGLWLVEDRRCLHGCSQRRLLATVFTVAIGCMAAMSCMVSGEGQPTASSRRPPLRSAFADVASEGYSSSGVLQMLPPGDKADLASATVLVSSDCPGWWKAHVDFIGPGLTVIGRSEERNKQDCVARCMATPGCAVWSWGMERNLRGVSDMCILRSATAAMPEMIRRHAVVSGLRNASICPAARQDATAASGRGWWRQRHGICLEAPVGSRGAPDLVHMFVCSDDGGAPQQWDYDEITGRVLNLATNLCLAAVEKAKEFSNVQLAACEDQDWTQQWSYDRITGLVKNWRGLCLNAGERSINGGMVYMRVCDANSWNQQWQLMDAVAIVPELNRMSPKVPAGTLYCFALMIPGSYEQDLLTMQAQSKVSLFACDAFDVVSNETIDVLPGIRTLGVSSDLQCDKGGEFGTALNLDIFVLVWQKVIAVGTYRAHDWTVKTDPDAVFIVDRLRDYLKVHKEAESTPTYLNNCKYGLHGPIEVLSRSAVDAWGSGVDACRDFFEKKCAGPCWWGEDMFVDQCFQQVLHAQRKNDFRLLVEDHCEPPPGWQSCSSKVFVAFHPFKTVDSYRQCMQQSTGQALTMAPTQPAPTQQAPTQLTTVQPATMLPAPTPPAPTARPDGARRFPEGISFAAAGAPTAALAPSSHQAASQAAPPQKAANPESFECHTVVPGDACYSDVVWAKSKGIQLHPEWYHGLTADSPLVEFQKQLHISPFVKCPAPCA